VAFYDSGVTALYHAASAAPDDEIRQAMLEKIHETFLSLLKRGMANILFGKVLMR
jgi:hypothetical protein